MTREGEAPAEPPATIRVVRGGGAIDNPLRVWRLGGSLALPRLRRRKTRNATVVATAKQFGSRIQGMLIGKLVILERW